MLKYVEFAKSRQMVSEGAAALSLHCGSCVMWMTLPRKHVPLLTGLTHFQSKTALGFFYKSYSLLFSLV
jgi:hypothetical protein